MPISSIGISHGNEIGRFTFGIGVGGWHRRGWWGPGGYRGYRRGYSRGWHRGYRSGARAGYRAGITTLRANTTFAGCQVRSYYLSDCWVVKVNHTF